MKINIYWNDLSDEGKETILNAGLVPTPDQLTENDPIGIFDTEGEDY